MTERAAPAAIDAGQLAARVQATFERVQRERMAGLPFLNPVLSVEMVGLRRWRGLWLGVLVTPWFMNLVLLPGDGVADGDEVPAVWPRVATGEYAQFAFPAGAMSFLAGREGEVGEYLACSLFSPVFEFADQTAARQTADACLLALFEPEAALAQASPAVQAAPVDRGRRAFLRGRRQDAVDTPAAERP
jgi:[NiFe] hydrogenase assembly HybE family chaperone